MSLIPFSIPKFRNDLNFKFLQKSHVATPYMYFRTQVLVAPSPQLASNQTVVRLSQLPSVSSYANVCACFAFEV